MVDCKLNLKKLNAESKETVSEGVVDTTTARFTGYDEDNRVEWTLTLKARDGEMPADYQRVVGEHIGNSVVLEINPASQQSKLEA